MAEFEVDTTRLNSDINDVMDYVNNINNKLQDLERQVAELGKMWDGAAWETFQQAYTEDLNVLNTLVGDLRKIYGFENLAKTKYEECEKAVSGEIIGI